MESGRGPRAVTVAVIAVARENGISLTAAGLAFYVFNSLVPLLVFAIVGVTAFGRLETVLLAIETVAGVDADRLLSAMEAVIGDGAGRRRAALIAAIVLLWSSFTMVQSVNMAFGVVYNSRKNRSAIGTATDSALVLGTVVAAVVLTVGVGVALTFATDDVVVRMLSVPLLLAALFGGFVPMFYRFSARGVGVREAIPGAAFAAVAWTACAVGFRVYAVTAESIQLYGVAGAVMLLLTWLYLGGLSLLLGAILNAVLAGRVDADDEWVPGA